MLTESLKVIKFIRQFKKLKSSKNEVAKKRALLYIKELLNTEGGILTKFLQYQSTNVEEMDELRELSQQKLEGIVVEEINAILINELGEEKLKSFSNISDYAIAASVGQVHHANLINQNNEDIIIKIQYPGIKQTFIDQLKILNFLPTALKITPLKKWGMDISSYQAELGNLIDQECDYNHEASELKKWEQYLIDQPKCFVPKVYLDYSNEKVITQSRIDGVTVDEIMAQNTWNLKEKRSIADTLIKAYFHLLFEHKTIQGDTNHGNFLFQKKSLNVYFIDLGQTIIFSDKFINSFVYLFKNKLAGNKYCAYSFFVGIGFDPKKLEAIINKLDLIIDILFQPFFSDYAYNINDWNYKDELDLLLGDDKWWFRSAGGTEFFLFMKSYMGLKNLISKLDSNVYYLSFLSSEMNKWAMPSEVEIKWPENIMINNKSSHIRILVLEEGGEKVKMTLPFMAIFDLEQYLSEEVALKIKDENIDINFLVNAALSDGGSPKNVFHIAYLKKEISIDLI